MENAEEKDLEDEMMKKCKALSNPEDTALYTNLPVRCR